MSLKPTCKEVHRLTSEGLDRQLSLVERTRVRMHLLVCTACQNFTAQMQLIRRAMRQLGPLAESDNERDQT
ncbi:zf-HC2 domain-containing protein [Noviherbaspirillum sp.]|uniref:zf-HC2 domain-containing protein n=1 Tax=Noviherbaspirillum sp. TaxID=1926288 RepID=UPI002B48F00F|nr:zf-HC2 domain-containing protein [Noviherbaspirillum sp.]HJV81686.1 zf-HC2 domain-containing protein [Noviherbaspirillum sp.]